jgi:zinc and cadmium transporter
MRRIDRIIPPTRARVTLFLAEIPISSSLVMTVGATLVVASVSLALGAHLSFRLFARFLEPMVSFSIGILLATTFLHLLPDAFDSVAGRSTLFATMLGGILGFFFLEKLALYRHSHHFEGDGHVHEHGHDAKEAGQGGALVLVGSAFHNFSDGILIAAAFLAGPLVGFAAALSILTHEVPHKIGDFLVLLNAGIPKRRALLYAFTASLCIVLGGLAGHLFLERLQPWIPFVLVIAAANFTYIALSDLVPRMQRGRQLADALSQAVLIACGTGIVLLLNQWLDAGH